MSKKKFAGLIILTVVLSVVIEILFGGHLSALLSTLPIVRKWNLFQPQAPIVINRRETVRSSDSNDIRDAVEGAKSKLSTIISIVEGQPVRTGAAVNLTSDGWFLTGQTAVNGDLGFFRVVLQDGRTATLQQIVADPATKMVMIKADINNVPVADIGSSKDAASGERVIFVYNSAAGSAPNADPNFVILPQRQDIGQVFNADKPSRTFGVEPVTGLVPGEAVVDLGGVVLAMWDGSALVSADVLKPAFQQVLGRATAITRPGFGFSYRWVGKLENSLTSRQTGAEVVSVIAGGAAQTAGLKTGDIIVKVEDTNIEENTVVEELLEKYRPGDRVPLTVMRSGQVVTLTLVAGLLK